MIGWTAAPARLAVAWLTMFLVGTELFVMSPLIPLLAVDFHVPTVAAGLAVTVFSLTYMVSAPLLGHLSDRIGRRRVLSCSLVAFTLANLLTASAPNLPSLLVVRLFAGAAAAGVSPSIYALVGGAAPPHRCASWLALTVSGLLVSLAVGASMGELAGAYFGWAPVFVALAAFSSLLAALNACVWPHDGRLAKLSRACSSRRYASTTLACRLIPTVVWSTGLYAVYTYLGTGLVAVGFSTDQIAIAILSYGCGAIVGVLIGGRSADRLGVKFTTGASLAGLCACFLLLRLALDASLFVEPALGVSSAVAQLFFPAQQAGLATDFPNQRGAALAWNNSALFFGISLGSLVGGQAVTFGNFSTNLTIAASIALIGWAINRVVVPGSTTPRAHEAEDSG
jgi:predicted MFS family arabinose efflux permease